MKRFFEFFAMLTIGILVLGMTASVISWTMAIQTDAPLIEQIHAKTNLIANAVLLILAINLDWLGRNDR